LKRNVIQQYVAQIVIEVSKQQSPRKFDAELLTKDDAAKEGQGIFLGFFYFLGNRIRVQSPASSRPATFLGPIEEFVIKVSTNMGKGLV